jgi:hypothetical protein
MLDVMVGLHIHATETYLRENLLKTSGGLAWTISTYVITPVYMTILIT